MHIVYCKIFHNTLWAKGPSRSWARIPIRRDLHNTTLCDKVCQWTAAGQWFFPVSSTNKTDHDI